METHRLKIKLGQFEFEAEGSEQQVQQQFDQFAKLVESQKKGSATNPATPDNNGDNGAPLDAKPYGPLGLIFRVDGEKLVLAVRPKTASDAMLVLLAGYKAIKKAEPVAVSALLQGIKLSGFTVDRMDEVTPTLTPKDAELIMKIGQRNASKYRLTAVGAMRAEQLIQELLVMLG
jgi:hypothetical protein